jgi:polyisoprenoid-binding protein YceI
MKLNIINAICIFVALSSGQASALEFKQMQVGESAVSFGYQQMGVAMEGKFNKFSAQVTFDPAKLANAQARIDIDLASIDAGSAEANDEVPGKLWFNAKTYPSASFVSSGVKSLGGKRYEVTGKLTIKGVTRDVLAPVTFQSAGNRGAFDGVFTIKRLDYKIGEGAWADLGTVANEIQIKFHIVVNAVPTKK